MTAIIYRTLVTVLCVFALSAPPIVWAGERGIENEEQLLTILQSDAPFGDKAIACKKLAIVGTEASVSELAKLLPNPQLSSWARIALEAIPGEAANSALCDSIELLDGELLVGTVNSIGVREEVNSVPNLLPLLKHRDPDVASSAAVALGKIGNDRATQSLRSELQDSREEVISAIAEGCILCAEKLHAAGKSMESATLYDEVRKANVPQPRIIEATRGVILAKGQDGIPMLIELLSSPDQSMFRLGLSTAREFPGAEIDLALATHMQSSKPNRAALILLAMADRPKTIQMEAVEKQAGEGAKVARIAAIQVLGRLGNVDCLDRLLEAAIDEDQELAAAAKNAIATIPDGKVDEQIAEMIKSSKGNLYPLLIEMIGKRRIAAMPALLTAVENPDVNVRRVAMEALGETVSLDQISVLIDQVLNPRFPEDADVATKSLLVASIRMPDQSACVEKLAQAMTSASDTDQVTLLEIISDVGGKEALNRLAQSAKSKDEALQDAGSRLLGKWNSVDAAPVLLDLAKTAPARKFQIRALRGYIGLVRKFNMPVAKRIEMCQSAMDSATRIEEKKLVLEVLKIHPSRRGMKMAITIAAHDDVLRDDAKNAAMAIAQKTGLTEEAEKLLSNANLR